MVWGRLLPHGGGPQAEGPQGAGDVLDRRLHQAGAGRRGHELGVQEDGPHQLADVLVLGEAGVPAGARPGRWRPRAGRSRSTASTPRTAALAGWATAMRMTSSPPKLPVWPKTVLAAGVVLVGGQGERAGLAAVLPAGEGPGPLLDVGLGVVADPEEEQLEQLPGEVLVGLALAVLVGVEPDEHGRVLGHRLGQGLEAAGALGPEDLVLPVHQLRLLDLLDRRGEVVVPEQGQALPQRGGRQHHAVHPPLVELAALLPVGPLVGLLGRPAGRLVGRRRRPPPAA